MQTEDVDFAHHGHNLIDNDLIRGRLDANMELGVGCERAGVLSASKFSAALERGDEVNQALRELLEEQKAK